MRTSRDWKAPQSLRIWAGKGLPWCKTQILVYSTRRAALGRFHNPKAAPVTGMLHQLCGRACMRTHVTIMIYNPQKNHVMYACTCVTHACSHVMSACSNVMFACSLFASASSVYLIYMHRRLCKKCMPKCEQHGHFGPRSGLPWCREGRCDALNNFPAASAIRRPLTEEEAHIAEIDRSVLHSLSAKDLTSPIGTDIHSMRTVYHTHRSPIHLSKMSSNQVQFSRERRQFLLFICPKIGVHEVQASRSRKLVPWFTCPKTLADQMLIQRYEVDKETASDSAPHTSTAK